MLQLSNGIKYLQSCEDIARLSASLNTLCRVSIIASIGEFIVEVGGVTIPEAAQIHNLNETRIIDSKSRR